MSKRRIRKIEKQIRQLHGPTFTVNLPELEQWSNPTPLTAEAVEEGLKNMKVGETLMWCGIGCFFKYASDDEAVITLSRSHLASDYLENVKSDGGEN